MMKKLISLFLIILAFRSAQAQADLAKNGLPRNARIISVSGNPGENHFDNISRILFRNDYEIKKSDRDAGTILTGLTKIKGGPHLRLKISIIGDVIDIKGDASSDSVGGHEISNTNAKTPKSIAFAEMDRIAKLIPHVKVEYLP